MPVSSGKNGVRSFSRSRDLYWSMVRRKPIRFFTLLLLADKSDVQVRQLRLARASAGSRRLYCPSRDKSHRSGRLTPVPVFTPWLAKSPRYAYSFAGESKGAAEPAARSRKLLICHVGGCRGRIGALCSMFCNNLET